MSIEAGRELLHYRLIEKIGEGGMGVVWKAVDTNLDREVAVKVLPASLADDPERLARLDREAKLLASLSHPNIATVHGLHTAEGVRFLVMELVAGEDLAARLERGPIPTDEALQIAIQVARALEAAHEQGIVHRDLKPGNIYLCPDESIKVLDFGLAKAVEPTGEQPTASLSMSPTLTSAGTIAGMILGTAGYMSPEQARGKPVDRRADIWALGVVLYEMLTGQKTFPGEDVAEVLAAVIKSDPDWEALPDEFPYSARVAIQRCLRRKADERFGDASGVRILLEQAGDEREEPQQTAKQPGSARWTWPVIGLALVAILLLQWWSGGKPRTAPAETRRYHIELPWDSGFNWSWAPYFDLTPDGETIVYAATVEGVSGLYVRPLDSFAARLLPGTEGAAAPFVSHDGSTIAFVAGNKLQQTTFDGVKPTPIADIPDMFYGGCWTPDGRIVYSPDSDSGLWIVRPGDEPTRLTEPDREAGETNHSGPWILPDGDSVVFSALARVGSGDDGTISLLSLASGTITPLVEAAAAPIRYVDSGHLLMRQASRLVAVPFDLRSRKVTGRPAPLFSGADADLDVAKFTASTAGTLVTTDDGANVRHQFVELTRDGVERDLAGSRHQFLYPAYSPDQQRVAVTQDAHIWVYEVASGRRVRVTSEGQSFVPLWTPDGERLLFGSYQPDENLYWKRADGSGAITLLLEAEHRQYPAAWHAPTSQALLTWIDPASGYDIWTVTESGDGAPLLDSPANERWPTLSPDGRYMAYASDESGRYEIYVVEFSGEGGKVAVSRGGGIEPRWSTAGDEIFFKVGSGGYNLTTKVMAVPVETEPRLKIGEPALLLEGDYMSAACCGHSYDVSEDGQRFVMVRKPEDAPRARMSIVLNGLGHLGE
jgi:serine/threonine protein kinase